MATKKVRPTPAASHVVLFTGFPGFIGARLIPRLLELKPDSVFHCLVQEKFLDLARQLRGSSSPGRTPQRRDGSSS